MDTIIYEYTDINIYFCILWGCRYTHIVKSFKEKYEKCKYFKTKKKEKTFNKIFKNFTVISSCWHIELPKLPRDLTHTPQFLCPSTPSQAVITDFQVWLGFFFFKCYIFIKKKEQKKKKLNPQFDQLGTRSFSVTSEHLEIRCAEIE